MNNPFGYGRVIRDSAGRVVRIVEQKDATPEEQAVCEINSGIYCMEAGFLYANIGAVSSNNAQQEFYLTDLVSIAADKGLTCLGRPVDDADEIMGVNDRAQLAAASRILRRRINHDLMCAGVSLLDPEHTYIDHGVSIGPDTVIHPNCTISGATAIASGCTIENGVTIKNCTIGDGCHIKTGSVLEESQLQEQVSVGPMAHLRPGTILHDHVKIGSNVNIGCGTITCNYDGVNKHRTIIGDDVFIGSDVQLVAPVEVGRNSLVAAGTTVTMEVPPDSLAISRVPQVNKVGWRLKKK